MNYNELTETQKLVVGAMHLYWMSKSIKRFYKYSLVEKVFNEYRYDQYLDINKLIILYKRALSTDLWIHKRAYKNECRRLAWPSVKLKISKKQAIKEAKEVIDYVKGEYRRMK